jgi:drug/metabolite transporter, DME family
MGSIALVVAAAILWSSSGFFTQTTILDVWPRETRGGTIAFWRAVFALLLLVPLVRKVSFHWVMIPMMGCFVGMNWTFLTAIVSGSPANTIWLQNLAPAWVMILTVFVFREPAALRDWAMMVICIVGVVFIITMEYVHIEPTQTQQWWSPILAVLSGVLYAGVILSVKALRGHDSAWLITINHIATALAMLPLVWWSGVVFPSGRMWLMLAGLGMFQMGLAYLLFAKALKKTPSHLASLITLLEPILLPVWVHLTRMSDPTYEPPRWWTWVGAGLILCGLSIRYAWPTRREESVVPCE